MKRISGEVLAVMVVFILMGSFITLGDATAEETGRDSRFIAYNNGTVLDTKTNLMWAAKDNGSNINWANAKSYCENYSGGGYTDWRMPTQDELAGLYLVEGRYTYTYKAECRVLWDRYPIYFATDLIRLSCYAIWASETGEARSASRGPVAKGFGFSHNSGRFLTEQRGEDDFRALPVRSVVSFPVK